MLIQKSARKRWKRQLHSICPCNMVWAIYPFSIIKYISTSRPYLAYSQRYRSLDLLNNQGFQQIMIVKLASSCNSMRTDEMVTSPIRHRDMRHLGRVIVLYLKCYFLKILCLKINTRVMFRHQIICIEYLIHIRLLVSHRSTMPNMHCQEILSHPYKYGCRGWFCAVRLVSHTTNGGSKF